MSVIWISFIVHMFFLLFRFSTLDSYSICSNQKQPTVRIMKARGRRVTERIPYSRQTLGFLSGEEWLV